MYISFLFSSHKFVAYNNYYGHIFDIDLCSSYYVQFRGMVTDQIASNFYTAIHTYNTLFQSCLAHWEHYSVCVIWCFAWFYCTVLEIAFLLDSDIIDEVESPFSGFVRIMSGSLELDVSVSVSAFTGIGDTATEGKIV